MIVVGAAKCRFCNAIFDPKLKQMGAGKDPGLKAIAKLQKWVNICILVQVVAVVAAFFFALPAGPQRGISPVVVGLSSVFWLAHIAGAVLGIILATKLYSVLGTVFLGLFAIIPCVGVIALLVVNNSATSKLQLSGVKVGFLGANVTQLK